MTCTFLFQILWSPFPSHMKVHFKKPRKVLSFGSFGVGKFSKKGQTFFYCIFGVRTPRRSRICAWLVNLTLGKPTSRGLILLKIRKNRKCDFPRLYIIRLEIFQVKCYIVILSHCNPAVKNYKKTRSCHTAIFSQATYLYGEQLSLSCRSEEIRIY